MFKHLKTISSFNFNLIFSIILIIFNSIFIKLCFSFLHINNDFFMMIMLPIILFAAFLLICTLLFIPYLTKPLSIILFSIASIGFYFLTTYGSVIDHDMIKNVVQTDSKEVVDLINIKLILWIIFLEVLPIIYIIKVKIIYKPFSKEITKRVFIFFILVIFIGICFAMLSKDYIPFFRDHKETEYYLLPSQPIVGVVKHIKRERKKRKMPFKQIGKDAVIKDNNIKKLLVLVIGETARGANMSSNGYTKNDTNFYTKQIENLITFKEFYSCGTATAISVPCMFSNMPRKRYDANKAENSENVLDILKRVGVDVIWLGNNSGGCKGICDRISKTTTFNDEKSGFDQQILDLALNDIKQSEDSTIITLHLQGSHGPTYFKRYPDEFKKFNPTCNTSRLKDCTQDELFNTYDNTLLYTDYIIYSLIQALKNKESSFDEVGLLYISDHGESLGENGVYLHGLPYFIAPDFQKHVAAQMWINNKNLNSLKEKELSQDNLFHTLLGYFDINSSIYDENLDMNRDIQ